MSSLNTADRSSRVLDILSKLKMSAPPAAGAGQVVSRRLGMSGIAAERTPGEDLVRPDLENLNRYLIGPNPAAQVMSEGRSLMRSIDLGKFRS